MNNIVGLRGKVAPSEPVPGVVELLEAALIRAKTGQIRAVAIAECHVAAVNSWWDGDAGTRSDMAGSIALLTHRFMTDWEASD